MAFNRRDARFWLCLYGGRDVEPGLGGDDQAVEEGHAGWQGRCRQLRSRLVAEGDRRAAGCVSFNDDSN